MYQAEGGSGGGAWWWKMLRVSAGERCTDSLNRTRNTTGSQFRVDQPAEERKGGMGGCGGDDACGACCVAGKEKEISRGKDGETGG